MRIFDLLLITFLLMPLWELIVLAVSICLMLGGLALVPFVFWPLPDSMKKHSGK